MHNREGSAQTSTTETRNKQWQHKRCCQNSNLAAIQAEQWLQSRLRLEMQGPYKNMNHSVQLLLPSIYFPTHYSFNLLFTIQPISQCCIVWANDIIIKHITTVLLLYSFFFCITLYQWQNFHIKNHWNTKLLIFRPYLLHSKAQSSPQNAVTWDLFRMLVL